MMQRQKTARNLAGIFVCALAFAVASALRSHAQGDEVLVFGFENGVEGWISFDPQARVGAADLANIKVGSGGMQYNYRLREGGMSLVGRPNIDITGSQSLSFWARGTHNTGLAFGVSEASGARYSSLVHLIPSQWTQVTLNLEELQIDQDSKDENGKLDIDQVNAIYFADMGIFVQMLNPEIRGDRKLWLDDLKFSRARAPSSVGMREVGGRSVFVVDSFENALLRWLTVSVTFDPVRFTIFPKCTYDTTTDVPEGGGKNAMKVGYARPRLSAFAVARDIHGLNVARTSRITFWLRSDRTGTFIATIEKTNGARYQQPFMLTPNLWTRVDLPLEQFVLADDSKDPDGALDMAKAKQFGLLDINLTANDAGDNTLYLDEVWFLQK